MDPAELRTGSVVPKQPITAAIQEVFREVEVRRRIYGRWVQEGKLTYAVAKLRGEAMESALSYLMLHPLTPEGFAPSEERKETAPSVF